MCQEGGVDAQSLQSHCSVEDINKCWYEVSRRQALISTRHRYFKHLSTVQYGLHLEQ